LESGFWEEEERVTVPMTKRQEKIFKIILEEYVKTAQAVSSDFLSKKIEPKISSATIRLEMAELVKRGYLRQEHISAGRMPTLKGFRYYVFRILPAEEKEKSVSEKKRLQKIKSQNLDRLDLVKELIKKVAFLSGDLGLVKFKNNDFYYTGFSYLFQQPEFQNALVLHEFSRVVDRLDVLIPEISENLGEETQILLGRKTFLGGFCSAIFARCDLPGKEKNCGLIGILGPVRMNYHRNLSLLEEVKEIINQESFFED
jgi:transcriptional regulator of heat shock response